MALNRFELILSEDETSTLTSVYNTSYIDSNYDNIRTSNSTLSLYDTTMTSNSKLNSKLDVGTSGIVKTINIIG